MDNVTGAQYFQKGGLEHGLRVMAGCAAYLGEYHEEWTADVGREESRTWTRMGCGLRSAYQS